MKKTALLVSVFALSALSATTPAWKTGKISDTATSRQYLQTGAASNTNGTATANTSGGLTQASGHSTTNTVVDNTAVQDTRIVIVGEDYAYTVNDSVEKPTGIPLKGSLARSIANRKHGCRYIIGDPIQYEQQKDKLLVKDGDGKECKLDILRQERIPPASPKP